MKSFYFKDGLQIVAAILLTSSMVYAMEPASNVKQAQISSPTVTETVSVTKTAPEPEKAPVQAPVQPETKPEPVKDPNNCEPAKYYAAEPPHECIDKPTQVKSAPTVATSPRGVAVSGSCSDWIAQAGISDVANANELIRRESGCNPNAVNRSSGACGVAQELPCGKSGCSMGDGACQVRWMNGYVIARYGSWANAVGFHNANNWY